MDGLPIFSFRPNWADGLTESLTFVSDVMASDTGNEQRRSLRLTPGRSFELNLLLQKEERSFFDLALNKYGAGEWGVPLWHDIGRLATGVDIGDDRLDFDTRWREFPQNSYAIIQGRDAFTFEEVQVKTVDVNGVTLWTPLTCAWGKGTSVMPLRRGRLDLDGDTQYSRATSSVAESTLRFNLTEPNPWTPAADLSPLYGGVPVFDIPPNYGESLDFSFLRNMAVIGNDFGKSYYADISGRAFAAQGHTWYLKGREAQASFRDMIYRNKGRVGSFWLPTFNDDMTLASPASAVVSTFDIKKIGYGLSGGPTPGRNYVLIELHNGTFIGRKVTVVGATGNPATERLQLEGALGTAITPANVKRISFMDRARFDTDQFDLQHHTDTDGVTTATAAFRTFRGDRDPSGPIYVPIPDSEMGTTLCGEPQRSTCGPCDPCPGYRSISMTVNGCNPTYWPYTSVQLGPFGPEGYEYTPNPPLAPGGPSGQSLNTVFTLGGGTGPTEEIVGYIYESNVFNDPDSEWYHHPLARKLQGQVLIETHKTSQSFLFQCFFTMGASFSLGLQYPAFYCSSVGSDGASWNYLICTGGGCVPNCAVDCVPINMCPEMPCLVGNVPYFLTLG